MISSTLALVIGYAALMVVSAALFTGAYFVVGTDAAFVRDSYEISASMAACGIAASFVGGLTGGWVSHRLSGRARVCRALAMLAFVLTLASGIPMLMRERPPALRPADIERLQAMTRAFHPRWFTLVFPMGQAAGVLVMAASRRQRRRT